MRTAAARARPLPPVRPAVEIIPCHDCGLVQRLPPLKGHVTAICTRCGSPLFRHVETSLEWTLASQLAALVLFYVANAYPIMRLELEGRGQSATIFGGVQALWQNGHWLLSLIVLMVGTLVPLIKILGTLYVVLPAHLGRHPRGMGPIFRLLQRLRPWSMLEVYLLGLIVAYVKLGELATLHLGVAAFGFVALVLVMILADASLEPHAVWTKIAPQAGPEVLRPQPGTRLVACEACDQLFRLEARAIHRAPRCPRCRAALHERRPESVQRSWALLLAAAILFVPANLFPIMTVVYFGQGEPSTIVGGIIELIHEEMVPIAMLVLFASIVVPMLKLVGLAGLLVSVQRGSRWRPRDRTRLYRIIEAIGRWSMIDVFMVAILTALVQLQNISSVQPEVGAVAFAAVVVITMLAAMTFDPRLIWDPVDERTGHEAAP